MLKINNRRCKTDDDDGTKALGWQRTSLLRRHVRRIPTPDPSSTTAATARRHVRSRQSEWTARRSLSLRVTANGIGIELHTGQPYAVQCAYTRICILRNANRPPRASALICNVMRRVRRPMHTADDGDNTLARGDTGTPRCSRYLPARAFKNDMYCNNINMSSQAVSVFRGVRVGDENTCRVITSLTYYYRYDRGVPGIIRRREVVNRLWTGLGSWTQRVKSEFSTV